MKVEYKYINGKAIVKDEEGYPEILEYSDNLDDILSQRNLVEEMENQMDKLVEDMGAIEFNLYEMNKHKKGLFIKELITVAIMISSVFLPFLILSILIILISVVLTFKNIKYMILAVKEIHELKKDINAKGVQYEYLEEELDKQKEKLEELENKESKKIKIENYKVVKVKQSVELDLLIKNLNIYEKVGYNENKYWKLHNNGGLTLENVNKIDNVTEEEFYVFKEYFLEDEECEEQQLEPKQENGPIKIKRKKKIRK